VAQDQVQPLEPQDQILYLAQLPPQVAGVVVAQVVLLVKMVDLAAVVREPMWSQGPLEQAIPQALLQPKGAMAGQDRLHREAHLAGVVAGLQLREQTLQQFRLVLVETEQRQQFLDHLRLMLAVVVAVVMSPVEQLLAQAAQVVVGMVVLLLPQLLERLT
jgi:hypothetical protein